MKATSVNLLWSRRYRGLLPVCANAFGEDGTLTFVRPDELEARTYQVVSLDADRHLALRWTLSVETVHKMEVAPAAGALIGVTDDDLYLFREQRKTRFMPGRRVSFSDVALSREGRIFGTAFSDIMFASHTVALCDMTGKIAWTKDLDFPIARVAVAPDGRQIVAGGEEGTLVAFDALRSLLWEAFQEQPVAALALAGASLRCVTGSPMGVVTAFDGGAQSWSVEVGLPVVALAVADAGDAVAVAAGDTTGGALILLDEEGAPTWEHELEARPTGVALSPDGTQVAVSTGDGGLSLLSFTRADAPAYEAGGAAGERGAAEALWADGRREEARERLAGFLRRSPGSVEACDRLAEWDAVLVAEALAEAGRRADSGDFAGAMARLDAAHALDPTDERVPAARRNVAMLASVTLRQQGRARLLAGDADGAIETWQALLALCPKDRGAHAEIAAARREQAARLTREGNARAAAGDTAGAVELWRRALALAPGEELAARLREAEVRQAMELGLSLYQERRYPEATFQFRRVLALDPDHEEAQRYLGYAQSMRSDSTVTDRFTRLE